MAKQKKSRRVDPWQHRLAAYRPVLDRIVFGVALLGMLVTAHLYIQQQRGFDRGCLGFSDPNAVSEGCAIVTQSEASTLFGVSNAIWGFLFYLVIVALSAALPALDARKQALAKRVRAALIVFGVFYSGYLVYYQTFNIGTFCELCLTSASLVGVLFVLQLVDVLNPPKPIAGTTGAPPLHAATGERRWMVGAAVAVLVLIGADFAYFNSLERGAPNEINFDTSTALATDGTTGSLECGYDPQKRPVRDYRGLVNQLDPYRGNPSGGVVVIEYFDPNCPHCATLYPVMERVAESFGDRAQFVYKPFVLWQQSVAQSAALYAAAQEGKFFEMLELQFANQQQTGLSVEQLREMAQHVGMNPDLLAQRIQSGIYMSVLEMQRRQGEQIGLTSVPAVLINGRFVATQSKTPECLVQLISAAIP